MRVMVCDGTDGDVYLNFLQLVTSIMSFFTDFYCMDNISVVFMVLFFFSQIRSIPVKFLYSLENF